MNGLKSNTVLVTGGAGYIGSHACVELINAGYGVVVIDNLSNSSPKSLERVEIITGQKVILVRGDIRDEVLIGSVLRQFSCKAVIHFAGLKSVGESFGRPLEYYENNVVGTQRLLASMQRCGVKKLVFSSSATVYGNPQQLPITETHPLSATNPYGRTKLMVEEMLRDLYGSDLDWSIAILRYFNPAGAHESGLIGEDPRGVPSNLMPYVAQVAVKRRDYLNVWGNDYATHDGTGVRDFIHVEDLASGHVKALQALNTPKCFSVNLGTGVGYSVLDVVTAFARVSGRSIPYQISSRRPGDVAISYSNPKQAEKLLGWKAKRDLQIMCKDHWRWQERNPEGYV